MDQLAFVLLNSRGGVRQAGLVIHGGAAGIRNQGRLMPFLGEA